MRLVVLHIPELLGIPMVKSDGDPWFMDLALKNFTTPQPIYSNIRKCDAWTSVEAPICSRCSTEEKVICTVL
ncbi:hypothetical protein TELCIR_09814 [Teladorsagia circumcincta]|uniref:Uncharacterized protein n=1 Tax=Teladorsagia circumcincta TaxID=45464 RepID=A0A2G9UFA8_TELCI|nr:hypothetical protein TELCIR_09814 [Teladorsagia circumcincta]